MAKRRKRTLVAGLLAAASAQAVGGAAVGPAARAATADDGTTTTTGSTPAPVGTELGGVTVTELDSSGSPTSSATFTLTQDDARSEPGHGTIASPGPSGCRYVDAWNTGFSPLGATVWRFHVNEKVCWTDSKSTVDVSQISTYASNLTAFEEYEGVVSGSQGSYPWRTGAATSGFQTFRQGHFRQCVLTYGCISNNYPYVKLYAHADGSLYFSRGGD